MKDLFFGFKQGRVTEKRENFTECKNIGPNYSVQKRGKLIFEIVV